MRLLSEMIARSAKAKSQREMATDPDEPVTGHPDAPAGEAELPMDVEPAQPQDGQSYNDSVGWPEDEDDDDQFIELQSLLTRAPDEAVEPPDRPPQAETRPADIPGPAPATETVQPMARTDEAPTDQQMPKDPAPSRQALAEHAMEILKARAPREQMPSEGGRVKTRLLGFNAASALETDVFGAPAPETSKDAETRRPVGWLAVVNGPGLGTAFTLFDGVAQIGRGSDQAIRLDFGDTAISRANHAAVAYDFEQNAFFLGHGGKANIVRLNDQPVLSTERLQSGDEIRIGETSLRFVALCDDSFAWDVEEIDEGGDV